MDRSVWIGAVLGGLLAGCDSQRAADSATDGEAGGGDIVEYRAEPIQPLPDRVDVDPVKVDLGGRLFHDTRLSVDETLSCASCHSIKDGGDDGRPTSVGVRGQLGPINAPTVLNSGLNIAQFWDGRAETLEDQAAGPVAAPVEMGAQWPDVVEKLKADPIYARDFAALYPEGITQETVTDAIAEFERTLLTHNAPFDLWLKGDNDALSPEALLGYQRFKEFGCVSCHQGRNVGGNMFQRFGVMGSYFEDRGDIQEVDYGRFNVTGDEIDRFYFRVPSLRNVALTAPYFHDGSVETLEEAVRIMGRYQLGRRLDEEDVAALAAFLNSLTGELPDVEKYR